MGEPMGRWWPAWALAGVALGGSMASLTTPEGQHAGGIWPAGLASVVLLLAGRRAWLWLPALSLVAFTTFWVGGHPVDVAGASALGIAAEVTVVWLVLTGSGRERPRLRSFADLDRYFVASVLGALTAAGVALATTAVTGVGDPGLVALSVGSAHLASQLVVLPFFLNPPVEPPTADRWEQVLAWLGVVAVTGLVFLLPDLPALGFLVMPLLVWGALRLGTWQALAQVVTVSVIASGLHTAGYGPSTWLPAGVGAGADAAVVLLSLFNVGAALVVIPLVLMVSLRRSADREAASERDKLARVVDAARGISIIGTDEDGRITLFNPGAERLLGYRRQDVLGRRGGFLHSRASLRAQAEVLGVAPDYLPVIGALVDPVHDQTLMSFLRSDGQERSHLVTVAEVVDDRGRVGGRVITSEDVTEQVAAQRSVEGALARMKEVDALKDSFISTVSHELRTPVTSIVGYLEMLGDGQFGELSRAQRDAVGRVETNGARLLALVDDLLTLARMNDGRVAATEGEPVDLVELVRAGCTVVAPQAEQSGVRLAQPVAACPDGHERPLVRGDRQALEGLVINLVGNAVKFTPEGGEVEVGVHVGQPDVLVHVRDTGIGIPQDELDLLFNRFFRSSVTRDAAIPGSGLGLAIARGVVEQHGGDIEVVSEVGVGTTFTVRLPLEKNWYAT